MGTTRCHPLTVHEEPGTGGALSRVERVQATVRGHHVLDNQLVGQAIRCHRDLVLVTGLEGVAFVQPQGLVAGRAQHTLELSVPSLGTAHVGERLPEPHWDGCRGNQELWEGNSWFWAPIKTVTAEGGKHRKLWCL